METETTQDSCKREEWEPICEAASLIGKKWHSVVVYSLLKNGASGFSKLGEGIDGISDKALSNTLKELEEEGVVERVVVSDQPFRVTYSLTDSGEELRSVIVALDCWSREHLTD